jgi:cytochrome c-type biogenesis protein CcmH/NrfF
MVYTKLHHWRRFVAAAFLLPLLAASPALAQESHGQRGAGEVSKVTQEVSKEIYSPFCPGKTLAMCPSGGASDVRQEIQILAKEGLEKQDIKEAIIDKYGEEFRMVEPPAQDNYALLSVLAGALVVCLAAIWFFAARRRQEGAAGDEVAADDQMTSEDRAYLEELRGEYMD